VPRPQLTTCFAVALFAGIVMGNFGSGMWYSTDFLNMPGGLYSGVWYGIFFGAGIVAKRGKWLEGLESVPLLQKQFCGVFATMLALSLLYYQTATTYWGSPSYDRVTAALFKGVMPMAIILAELFVFQRFLNFSGKLSKFLADAAYTVYLIHPLVVIPMCFAFCKMMEASGVGVYGATTPSMYGVVPPFTFVIATENQEAVAWGGWLFTTALAELVVWPLAWCIAKAPLLRRVL